MAGAASSHYGVQLLKKNLTGQHAFHLKYLRFIYKMGGTYFPIYYLNYNLQAQVFFGSQVS